MGKLSKEVLKDEKRKGNRVHSLELENEMIETFLEISKALANKKINRAQVHGFCQSYNPKGMNQR